MIAMIMIAINNAMIVLSFIKNAKELFFFCRLFNTKVHFAQTDS